LKAQLFLDINPVKDSVQHYSATIFDVYQTYYNLPEEPFTNCFLNIYFDLFEIERQKMEKIIAKHKFNLTQFDSLYKLSVANLDKQTSEYTREVERGKNTRALKKWSDYVRTEIGIDNIQLLMSEDPALKAK
jgi:Trm5-related predicted tRNA methylase